MSSTLALIMQTFITQRLLTTCNIWFSLEVTITVPLKKVACFLVMFASQSSSIHFYTFLEKTFTSSKLKVAIIHLHGPYQRRTSILFVDGSFQSNLHGCVALVLATHFIYLSTVFPVDDLHYQLKIGTETIFISSIELLALLIMIVFVVGSWP